MNDKSMPDEIWLFTGNNNATKQLADEPDDDIKDLHTQYTRTQTIVELLEGKLKQRTTFSKDGYVATNINMKVEAYNQAIYNAIQAIKDMK